MEKWIPILGYEGLYSVSDLGNIRSETRFIGHYAGGKRLSKGKEIKPYTSMHGYLIVTLCKDAIHKKTSVHRIVLASFTRENKKLDVCHIDGTRTNNQLSNLKWGTRSENMQDCVRHNRTNRGTKNPNAKITPDIAVKIFEDKRTQAVIAKEYGLDQSTISNIKTGKIWGHVTKAIMLPSQ